MKSFLKKIVRVLRYFLKEICLIYKGNSIIASYLDIPAKKNQVNIYQYHPKRFGYDLYQNKPYNLGDSLGEVIVDYFLKQKGIDINAKVSSTKHLYCVGSNIQVIKMQPFGGVACFHSKQELFLKQESIFLEFLKYLFCCRR